MEKCVIWFLKKLWLYFVFMLYYFVENNHHFPFPNICWIVHKISSMTWKHVHDLKKQIKIIIIISYFIFQLRTALHLNLACHCHTLTHEKIRNKLVTSLFYMNIKTSKYFTCNKLLTKTCHFSFILCIHTFIQTVHETIIQDIFHSSTSLKFLDVTFSSFSSILSVDPKIWM